jgi:hypothetical protein
VIFSRWLQQCTDDGFATGGHCVSSCVLLHFLQPTSLSLLRESMFVSNYVLAVLPCLASTGPQLSLDPLKAWHLQKYRRDISEVGIISHIF